MDLSFEAPAQVWGDTSAQNLTWVALVFSEGDAAAGNLEAPLGSDVENHSYMRRFVETDGVGTHASQTELPVTSSSWEGSHADFSARQGRWSSLLVGAPTLRLDVEGGRGSLVIGNGDRLLSDLLAGETPASSHRPDLFVPAGDAILTHAEAAAFLLRATGPMVVEWHEFLVECPGDCVDGAHTTVMEQSQATAKAQVERRTYTRLSLEDGNLMVQGDLYAVLAGGSAVDLSASRMRLPLASGDAACEDCIALDRQDLHANGSLALRGLRAEEGRLQAGFSGEAGWMRVDEATIHRDRLFGAHPAVGAAVAVSVVAVALAMLWKVKLAALFVRVTRDNALNHEGRRRIFEAVRAAPGSTAHALARRVGHSRATIDHHLRKLCDVGLIVSKETGKWSRFYENHGRYDSTWRQVHGLNDPNIRLLHAILEQEQTMSRSALLHRVQTHLGWANSTARYRIQRLEQAGLATRTIRNGRIWYEAHSVPGPAPP